MRCLALAQAWQDLGDQVVFLSATLPPILEARIKAERMDTRLLAEEPGSAADATQTANMAHQLGAAWVVVDGYQFGAQYQQMLETAGLRVLFIDDYGHAERYSADLVLNQNSYAKESMYPVREQHTRLLLGTHYALLRREFLSWQGWRREIPETAHKLLVTLGGTDPSNMTQGIVKALQQVQLDDLEAVVLVGSTNPYARTLQATIQRPAADDRLHRIRLQYDAIDMPGLMAWRMWPCRPEVVPVGVSFYGFAQFAYRNGEQPAGSGQRSFGQRSSTGL